MKVTKSPYIKIERCPYLGLHDDDSTSLAYPSTWNYCYHATPPASIQISHQVEICLCPHYVDCTVMLSNKWGRLPPGLRGRAGGGIRKNESSRRLVQWIALFVVVLLLTIVFILAQGTFF